jgi:hypothetical protein
MRKIARNGAISSKMRLLRYDGKRRKRVPTPGIGENPVTPLRTATSARAARWDESIGGGHRALGLGEQRHARLGSRSARACAASASPATASGGAYRAGQLIEEPGRARIARHGINQAQVGRLAFVHALDLHPDAGEIRPDAGQGQA